MVYAYDNWVQLPTRDLYDTQVMAMAINAAKDMYEKGQQEMKDFRKEYGDFMTPIAADQAWYDQNVTGKIRDTINALYAQGIDPLRNAQGRAMISQVINSMPYGIMSQMRQSAANANTYLKARAALEAEGKYNPLLAKYDGPQLSQFSTVNNGVWDKMSPTPYENMATFGNPYFEGMKPNVHRESINGIDYSIESITEQDLKNVADAHFNELVSTPQGQLMFKYYRELAGGDSNPQANEKAREMFNNAVADGQRRRIYTKDDYNDQWAKHEQLKQGWAKINQDAAELQLRRDQFNWEKDYYERQLNGNGNGANGDIPTAGASDQLALDQHKQYTSVRNDYYGQLDKNEKSSYNKLSERVKDGKRSGEKVIADKYKKALKTIDDPKASESDKYKANMFIQKWYTEGSDQFRAWVDDYKKSTHKDESWAKYSSSLEENSSWGLSQDANDLLKKSHEAFQRQNIVSGSIDTGMQKDLNHALSLTEGDDGMLNGTVTNDIEFSPITEASMTGNRVFRHNSKVNKINRTIKGKDYKTTITGRKYGSGEIKGARYNVIQYKARFTDAAVVEELKKYSDAELKAMGIDKIDDNTYDIPVTAKYSRGSQTWANINSETDNRIGGNSEATKRRATRQAAAAMNKIQ